VWLRVRMRGRMRVSCYQCVSLRIAASRFLLVNSGRVGGLATLTALLTALVLPPESGRTGFASLTTELTTRTVSSIVYSQTSKPAPGSDAASS
jgi:hypothetical protein